MVIFYIYADWIRNVVSAVKLRRLGAILPKRRQDVADSERRRAGERQQEVAERKPNPVYPTKAFSLDLNAFFFILNSLDSKRSERGKKI